VGDVDVDGGVLVIRRITVTYHLAVAPDADRAKIDRAFRAHPSRCPVYRSIHPQIEVATSLEVAERRDGSPGGTY
jgi:uncharacterized OsmC-like protein